MFVVRLISLGESFNMMRSVCRFVFFSCVIQNLKWHLYTLVKGNMASTLYTATQWYVYRVGQYTQPLQTWHTWYTFYNFERFLRIQFIRIFISFNFSISLLQILFFNLCPLLQAFVNLLSLQRHCSVLLYHIYYKIAWHQNKLNQILGTLRWRFFSYLTRVTVCTHRRNECSVKRVTVRASE